MSLEAKIDALTAAISENNELLRFMTSKAREGVSKSEATKSVATEKAIEKGAEKTTTKPAAEKPASSRSRSSSSKKKAPSDADMVKATTDFLEVDGEDEYNARRDLVKSIVEHFGVKKMSQIDEAERQNALNMLDAYKNGDDPFEGVDADADDDLA